MRPPAYGITSEQEVWWMEKPALLNPLRHQADKRNGEFVGDNPSVAVVVFPQKPASYPQPNPYA